MKKTWIGYVALGIAAYLVFFAVNLPVAHAYRYLAPNLRRSRCTTCGARSGPARPQLPYTVACGWIPYGGS